MYRWRRIADLIRGEKINVRRWTWILVALTLCLIWFALIFLGIRERESALRDEQEQLSSMCQVVSEQSGNLIHEMKIVLETLDIYLASRPGADPRTDPDFLKFITHYRSAYKIPVDVRLVSSSGGLFYIPSKSSAALTDARDREYFKAQMNPSTRGFFIAESVLSRVTHLWGIPISYPLSARNGGMEVIFSAIELPELTRLHDYARSKNGGTVTLIRDDGKILCATPFDAKLMNASVSGEAFWQQYTRSGGEPGIITADLSVYHMGKSIIAYRRLDKLPLVIAVSSNCDAVLHGWMNTYIVWTAIASVLSLLIILLGLRISRLFSRLELAHAQLGSANESLNESMGALRQELDEKEIMMREVYHRLKNQMAQLVMMIDLSSMKKSEDVFDVLKARIQSYGILYDKLTYTEDVSTEVYLSIYIKELVTTIISIYSGKKNIRYQLDCPDFELNMKKSTIIAMILCELMTNSIKYASEGEGELVITVWISNDGGKIRLVYSDNGPGFDYESYSSQESVSHLGFILINSFVRQYKGSLSYSRENGSTFAIEI